MIAIIDYGVGNLFSLKSSLKQLGLEAVVTADADTIRKADRLILPGVGALPTPWQSWRRRALYRS